LFELRSRVASSDDSVQIAGHGDTPIEGRGSRCGRLPSAGCADVRARSSDVRDLRGYSGTRDAVAHGMTDSDRPCGPAAAPGGPDGDPPRDTKLSVMDWLVGVGHIVAQRIRTVPRSPMVRLHPKR